MTFDGWDTQYYGDYLSYGQDSLMHFRTKGSKNGVRRYQEPDGTWTPLGLRERKAREGWGERRAARKEARAQRRDERRAARAAARSENLERAKKYRADKAEEKRLRNPKKMTDAELKKGIERLKLEQDYKEMARSPILKTGATLAAKYLEYQARKEEKEARKAEREMQLYRLSNERLQAYANLNRAKADRSRARADAFEVLKGKKSKANKAKLVEAKTKYRDTTFLGGIAKFFNKTMSSIATEDDSIRKARAEVDGIIAGRNRVDKYNSKYTGSTPMAYLDTPYQREKDKRTHLETLGRLKAEQDRQQARKEKWKARQKP